jgi:protein-tyrosine-phosphatase
MTTLPALPKRIIWAFALGFLFFYTPYAGLAKAVTAGLIPGVPAGLVGLEILPSAILGTVLTWPLIITILGWWRYVDVRRFAGIPIPVTTPAIAISGVGLALIIGSTTVAFTFKGISIVLALLLMRGGLLIMGPVIDSTFGRRVRWFSWAALMISFAALAVSFAGIKDRSLPLLAAMNLAIYLTGYLLRTPCMTKAAKVTDRETTYRYFVQEILVTSIVLPAIPAIVAVLGNGPISLALRNGFTTFWTIHPAAILPVVLVGVFYASHNIFGTLIYLDCRENTFCIPLFCGASFLAGFSAVFLLSIFFGFPAPPLSQLVSSGMIIGALLLLSPFHHRLEDAWDFLTGGLRGATLVGVHERLILFVCSGNTCRSPMAAAISNAEIALRTGLPIERVLLGRLRAESAGLTPRTGSPITPESNRALHGLTVPPSRHIARPITPEHVALADSIYCMTESQRQMLVQQFPEAGTKAHCLDPAGDIPDPIGHGDDVYADVARRLRDLVRMRFDEMGIGAPLKA